MIYDATTLYAIAGTFGISLAALTLCTIPVLLLTEMRDISGKRPKKSLVAAVAIFILTASMGAWGAITSASTIAANDTEAAAHFKEYGLHLTGDEAAEIRDHRGEDHSMYLEADGVVTEVLFRNVDGAVEPFTSAGDGTWAPMEAAG